MLAFLIRTDRYEHLRRPIRMSAPTDADVCTDRCGCLHRPMRMSAPTDADWRFKPSLGTYPIFSTQKLITNNYPHSLRPKINN
ncbi:hypothetical protein [Leyella stercorea]|uniref:hypothetical protein n=1 Tax=Leyella stercorea TaxID=363265 RepID=UPI00242E343D|nr:hypothetical protein [Leyella stercorea]